MLTVANVYRLHALKFVHAWHKGVLPELFIHFFQVCGQTKSPQISSKYKYWQTNYLVNGKRK